MLTAVAMGEEAGKLTNKILLVKTKKRFQAKHSIFSVYANALTFLSTHFIERLVPSNLPQFQVNKLDSRAIETIEWMKIALEADHVYPVNPNLVTSCDDSTILVIKGVQDGARGGNGRLLMLSTTILRYATTSKCKAKTKYPKDSRYGSPLLFQRAGCWLLPTSWSVV